MPFATGRLAKGDRILVCVESAALDGRGELNGRKHQWREATIIFHMPAVGDTEEQWCARVDGKPSRSGFSMKPSGSGFDSTAASSLTDASLVAMLSPVPAFST